MASQIQDIIGQITDGQYSDIPLNCTFAAGTISFSAASTNPQGENSSCVFLGKFMQFSQSSANYNIYSLAGGNLDASDNPSLTSVDPTTIPGLTLTAQTIPQNLDVDTMAITGFSPINNYGLGFVQSLGTSDTSGDGSYQSGGQSILMVDSSSSLTGSDPIQVTGLAPAQSATICLTDGTQFATIDIGDADTNSNQLSVNTQILGTAGNASCH
jgi:hypothetical protein